MKLLFKSDNCVFCKQIIKFIVIGKTTTITGIFPYAQPAWQLYYTSSEALAHVTNLLKIICPICDKQWKSGMFYAPVVKHAGIQDTISTSIKYTGLTRQSLKELSQHLLEHQDISNKGYKYCNICIKDSKRFIYELNLYPANLLDTHIKKGDKLFLESTVSDEKKQVTVNIKELKNVLRPLMNFEGHPICKFCNERYVDSMDLKHHMKQKHEECSLCKISGKSSWFKSINQLKDHYKDDHIVCDYCTTSEGLIGFADEIDYMDHLAAAHNIMNKIRIGQKAKKNAANSSLTEEPLNLDSIADQLQPAQPVQPARIKPTGPCVCTQNSDLKPLCLLFHHDSRILKFRDFLIALKPLDALKIYDELYALQDRLFTYPNLADLVKWLMCTCPVQFRQELKSSWKPWYESNCKFPDLFIADCVSRFIVTTKPTQKRKPVSNSMLHMVNRGSKLTYEGVAVYLPWLWTDVPLIQKKEEEPDTQIVENVVLEEPIVPQRRNQRQRKVVLKLG